MDSDARQAANLSGSQIGDVSIGAAAGGNVYNNADAGELRAFVRDYIWHLDQQTELYRGEQRQLVRQIQLELWVYRLTLVALVLYMLLRL